MYKLYPSMREGGPLTCKDSDWGCAAEEDVDLTIILLAFIQFQYRRSLLYGIFWYVYKTADDDVAEIKWILDPGRSRQRRDAADREIHIRERDTNRHTHIHTHIYI